MSDATVEVSIPDELSRCRELARAVEGLIPVVLHLGWQHSQLEGLACDVADEPEELAERYYTISKLCGLDDLKDALRRLHGAVELAQWWESKYEGYFDAVNRWCNRT
jgi:hypothetical protein